MKRRRRTKTAYAALFDNPKALFPSCETILFPNGEAQIWFRDDSNSKLLLRVSASLGPAGLSVTIQRSTCGLPLTISGNVGRDYAPLVVDDVREITVTQYRDTPAAQAFKRWYQSDCNDEPQRDELRREYERLQALEGKP